MHGATWTNSKEVFGFENGQRPFVSLAPQGAPSSRPHGAVVFPERFK